MHRTVYTVQNAIFCTEVYGASGHRMYSRCCTYCNQTSINILTLTRKLSIDHMVPNRVVSGFVRGYIDILIILLISTPLVLAFFYLLRSFLKCFLVLVYVSFVQYSTHCPKNIQDCSKIAIT